MWTLIQRWNAAPRQKRTGWLIMAASLVYIFYFLKARLFGASEPIATKEWVYFGLSFVGIMLGTINIRMAEMRERNQQTMPLIDPGKIKK